MKGELQQQMRSELIRIITTNVIYSPKIAPNKDTLPSQQAKTE